MNSRYKVLKSLVINNVPNSDWTHSICIS